MGNSSHCLLCRLSKRRFKGALLISVDVIKSTWRQHTNTNGEAQRLPRKRIFWRHFQATGYGDSGWSDDAQDRSWSERFVKGVEGAVRASSIRQSFVGGFQWLLLATTSLIIKRSMEADSRARAFVSERAPPRHSYNQISKVLLFTHRNYAGSEREKGLTWSCDTVGSRWSTSCAHPRSAI